MADCYRVPFDKPVIGWIAREVVCILAQTLEEEVEDVKVLLAVTYVA